MTFPAPTWKPPAGPRPSRAALSSDAIVDVAVKILDRDGLGAMTMRRVAQELGTGPASLYAHVANLRELEDLVYDRICGEVPLPKAADPQRWREQLKRLLLDSIEVMRRHNGVGRLGLGRIPLRDNSMLLADAMLGLLHAGRVPDQYAAWAVDMLGLFITGAAYEESLQRDDGLTEENTRDWFNQYGVFLASLPADRFPNLARMAPVMVQGDGDDRLEFGLDLLIAGLAATAGSPPAGATAKSAHPKAPKPDAGQENGAGT